MTRILAITGALLAAVTIVAAFALRIDASGDRTRVSNRGHRVADVRGLVVRSAHADSGTLLAIRGRRALYRLDRADDPPCFGTGPADQIGVVDSATCARGAFPTSAHPILDFSVYEGTRRDVRELSLFRVEGVAADGVAAVEFLRPNGIVALTVPVSANVYATTNVPKGAVSGVAALDKNGKRIWRSP
jgi:hypothetical protein